RLPGMDQGQRDPWKRRGGQLRPVVRISVYLYPDFVQLLYKVPSPAAARNETSRLRTAITAFFAMDGFVFANWAVRIPAVKASVGASPATLGIALLGVSLGAIATMAATGALCRRFGSPRLIVAGAVWLSLALLLPALARSAVALGLALAVFGVGYGGLNVAMNSLAVDLVAVLRRPVMPSFHAAWSLGGLAGAALGGLAAPVLAPLPHFALVGLLGLAVTAGFGRTILTTALPAAHAPPGGGTTGPRSRRRGQRRDRGGAGSARDPRRRGAAVRRPPARRGVADGPAARGDRDLLDLRRGRGQRLGRAP